MKRTAHPAAILPTGEYTEHVDAHTHPALCSPHRLPHAIPNDTMGSSFSFLSLFAISPLFSTPPPCFFLSLYLHFPSSLRTVWLLRQQSLGTDPD